MKKNTMIAALTMLPMMASANMYKKNLQVFTANTAEKRCSTPLHLVYKGNKEGYGTAISKDTDELNRAIIGGLDSGFKGGGVGGGVAVGAIVFAVNGVVGAATGDYEYLYVTECNKGVNRTRLMTLVVSNTQLSESTWVSLAKKDQARSGK